MKRLLSFLLLAPLVGIGQGVHFENGLNWQQVLAKAKAEHKYIFVDCYATWCGPCKAMDRNIYPNDSVGSFMNSQFISVKVQIDTSKNDDDQVRGWYADAHEMMYKYKISALPSFLFFSPDGVLVHRGLGYQQPTGFIQLASDAKNPQKQYYGLLRKYGAGELKIEELPALAEKAKSYNDTKEALEIATDYIHYLEKQDENDLYTPEHLSFITKFGKAVSSNDKVFAVFLHNGGRVDSIMHDPTYARRFIGYMVTKEEITPAIELAKEKGREPDWREIGKGIKSRFGGSYVDENLVAAQVKYYKSKQDWKNYTKFLVKQMDLTGVQNVPNDLSGILLLNNSAWDIFLHSDNKEELEKAIAWSDRVMAFKGSPLGNELDTKANLLYKLGRTKEAIELEEKAIETDPKDKELPETLEKMQRGQPTWASNQLR